MNNPTRYPLTSNSNIARFMHELGHLRLVEPQADGFVIDLNCAPQPMVFLTDGGEMLDLATMNLHGDLWIRAGDENCITQEFFTYLRRLYSHEECPEGLSFKFV